MIPRVRLGRTGLEVSRIGLGGFPFCAVNRARNWDPYSAAGRATAIETVRAAVDAGINYFDTAQSYGNGHSERIVGEATEPVRDRVVLATKVGYDAPNGDELMRRVEGSLERLRTDFIDVMQLHGGMYTREEVEHILNDGLVDALFKLRDQGKVRFVGFTVEEAWTARPLIATGQFDVIQVRYNLIHQAAAFHALDEAQEADMGITVMRPMTSGMFQRICHYLAPRWGEAHDLYEVALKYVLSDSRVHVACVGMRWPHEVAKNAALTEAFRPPFDMAELPRRTQDVYHTEDEMEAPRDTAEGDS
jgi:aryl-alcohol dehydrogenase-like predicted oxidoreductase